MANSITYKDKQMAVGDTISINYKIKEGSKERQQLFEGILTKIKGQDGQNRMITVRKVSNVGIGVERIIPLSSPFISGIKLVKKSVYSKAKLYFLRNLSAQKLRQKLYKTTVK
ncbi:MAG: 50S ribosomal protein L19 [Candidatus Roizmanbacteria bacterium]|nr:MAG: 50S ribosomal protein L19 [Candidatus Roizmanbacteria bacterium]